MKYLICQFCNSKINYIEKKQFCLNLARNEFLQEITFLDLFKNQNEKIFKNIKCFKCQLVVNNQFETQEYALSNNSYLLIRIANQYKN
jgi:hypothetical protein